MGVSVFGKQAPGWPKTLFLTGADLGRSSSVFPEDCQDLRHSQKKKKGCVQYNDDVISIKRMHE